MSKFYSQLVSIEPVLVELNELDLSEEEKVHLSELVDATMHHTILDSILSKLSEPDKELFLAHLATNDDQRIWEFLRKKIDKIEDHIQETSEGLKKQLHQDLKEAKKIKQESKKR